MSAVNPAELEKRPIIGISSCLLGHEVRYDGGHKRNLYILANLSDFFDFRHFCPEEAIGLPTPRKPIRLVTSDAVEGGLDAVEIQDPSKRYGQALTEYAASVTPSFAEFAGYIVKKDSPSCGMERVKVYEKEEAPPVRNGVGRFTAKLLADCPELPVEEEGRLMDPRLRENFITRVFTLFRWRQLMAVGLSKQALQDFHRRHKFLMLAHNEATYRELGRLVSDLQASELSTIASSYIQRMMTALKTLPSPGKHANVLMHMMGFIKGQMTSDEKEELLGLIDDHRMGLVPIIVPITLMNHFLRRYPNEYIEDQYYLEPHPRELMLRNTI